MKTLNTDSLESKGPAPDSPTTAIALFNPKSPLNMGAVLRAAGCFEAQALYYCGHRYNRASQFVGDTKLTHEKILIRHVDSLQHDLPKDLVKVAIELTEGAKPLMTFEHPARAVYIFGPEDGTLPQALLYHCDEVVYIPTIGCLNLAGAVNVVLYDRLLKGDGKEVETRSIRANRDNRNRTRLKLSR